MVKWKRENVPDHKFDFVDVREFERPDCLYRMRYSWVFFTVLKSVLVYVADLWTASALLLTDKWAGAIKPEIPFEYSKWIFVGSIVASFILLTWEIKKANAVISSRDISVAYTNIIAYRYYTMMSYAHWCFFLAIRERQKRIDKIAFFVYFGFKGWKRLLFCDGPRQVINFITLFSLFQEHNYSHNLNAYGSVYRKTAMGIMAFTVAIFVCSIGLLLLAFILYLPLLCKIQGNLKEYCCFRIDKRISELLAKQRARRIKETSKEQKITIQPTLPEIEDVPQNQTLAIQNYPSPPISSGQYIQQNQHNAWYSAKDSASIPIHTHETPYDMPSAPHVPPLPPKNVSYYSNPHPNKMQNFQYSDEASLPYSQSQYNYKPDSQSMPLTSPQDVAYPMPSRNIHAYNAPSQYYKEYLSEEIPTDFTRANSRENLKSSSSTTLVSNSSFSSNRSDGASMQTNSQPLLGRYGQDRTNRRRYDNYTLQGGGKK
ncbi:16351_t:CDS:2 [Acaulospora morrowiae]|uniref:16351_t:CDS:1 n=1 Tax=Acaulospora morrowiae TaxID=94023 RepID=A0A9N9CH08_9GLOM|nr:16351_t:CDS:2 [Acaulospora morrowiae]